MQNRDIFQTEVSTNENRHTQSLARSTCSPALERLLRSMGEIRPILSHDPSKAEIGCSRFISPQWPRSHGSPFSLERTSSEVSSPSSRFAYFDRPDLV